MAKTFEEVYAQLSADERKLIDNVFAKEPELKGGWTRLDDYTRKTQELAQQKKQFESELEYAQRMKVWADDNVPKFEELVKKGVISEDGEDLWEQQKADYERQLAEAKAAAIGDGMNPEELEKRVREIVKDSGLKLTTEEIKALYANEGRKMAEEVFTEQWKTKEENFNTNTIPMVAGFGAGVA